MTAAHSSYTSPVYYDCSSSSVTTQVPRFSSVTPKHGHVNRRTQSVRPNYHSLEINATDDLYSPVPQMNKFRSASVDECKLRSKQYDDLLNDVDEYITKDLKIMNEERIERETSRKMGAGGGSFSGSSSSPSTTHSPSTLSTTSGWEGGSAVAIVSPGNIHHAAGHARRQVESHAYYGSAQSHQFISASQQKQSQSCFISVRDATAAIKSPSHFSFSNMPNQLPTKTRIDFITSSPRQFSASTGEASPIVQRPNFGNLYHFADRRDSAASLVTPKSADSVFTFDLPPQTPPVKVEPSNSNISCGNMVPDQLCKFFCLEAIMRLLLVSSCFLQLEEESL